MRNIMEKMKKSKNDKHFRNFMKERNTLLGKYGYKEQISLEFPQYNQYPDELRLAILIVQKHQGKFVTNFLKREDGKDE